MATKIYFQKIGLILFFVSISIIIPKVVTAFPSAVVKKLSVGQNTPIVMEWNVNGTTRKAMVYIPPSAKNEKTPLIFAFHGHGGTMNGMYTSRKFDQLWPEAIFVCPQGLNTPGMLTDPEGKKAGWQMKDDTTNQDLDFFDAMLKTFKTDYKIDTKKIFVTGHSNGGGFTYLLWAVRGNIFAGFAPTSTMAGKLTEKLTPKPVLHATGETDPLIKPIWQKQTTDYLLKLNKCAAQGQKIDEYTTAYPSAIKSPVLIFSHPGGHAYLPDANVTIINFFKSLGN